MNRLYALTAVVLIGISLYGLIRQDRLLYKIMALNIMSSAVFLLLGSIAQPGTAPFPDPVPHAMVLTGIVVSVSATGFFLALAARIRQAGGEESLSRPPREDPPGHLEEEGR